LGKVKLPELNRSDIEKLRDAVASGRTATTEKTKKRGVSRVTGGEGAATRTLRALSVVLNYAVERGYMNANPTVGVKKTPDARCERFLSVNELERLGRALDQCEGDKDPRGLDIIRLLALTGCRRREIEGLRWDEVDLERGFLRLKDSKTGAKVVFLSRSAAALLSRVTMIAGSPWVFPATTGNNHYQNATKIWRDVRKAADLGGVRLHDLRHTYASQSLSEGASLEVVAALLGHKERRTTERYAHLSSDPIRAAAEKVGNAIETAMRA
jgi:integrase